jgi:WD40 repeat protein
MPHDRSVNCAYFSPQGEHLVTVCQNNYVYLYDTKSPTKASIEKPTLSIPHDNHTGRWLTKFHAAWDPKQSKQFVLGCMLHPRRIQIFDATRKRPIQELTSDFFNSVHSINAFHPILPLLTGGNSSGRLCLWRYNN